MRAVIGLIVFISLLGIKNGELAAAEEKVECKEIDQKKLIEMLEKEKEKLVIVDYRTPDDYSEGHIPGAILLSPKDRDFLQQRLDYLALQWRRKGKTAIIVDNDGREAKVFCRNMKLTTNYEKIYSLKTGMRLWTQPMEKGEVPAPVKKGKK